MFFEFLIFLIIFVFLFLSYWFATSNKFNNFDDFGWLKQPRKFISKYFSKSNSEKSNEKSKDEKLEVKSCNCPELASSHPSRVNHKSKCPIFRKLNPDLSYKDFMKSEGFPCCGDGDWPALT